MKAKISVAEALQKVESGESIQKYSIDFNRIKIESLDVMKLSKGGVVVPEDAIYYDDKDFEQDEDFEGDWVRIDADPIIEGKLQTEVRIALKKDIKQWVDSNHIKLDILIEQLLDSFYTTQKMVSKD